MFIQKQDNHNQASSKMMTYTLREVASVIRSKNAGPFELCFDIIFIEEAFYQRCKEAEIITKASFAELYGITADKVLNVVYFDPAKALKITIVRPISSGALGEKDVYGAQQHRPLVNFQFQLAQ
nr:DUF4387 domain-containing protein [Ignatzschineria cameli]